MKEVKGVEIFKLKMPFKVAFTGHPSWPDCKIYSQLTGQEMDVIFPLLQIVLWRFL